VLNHLQDCAEDYRLLDRVYLPLTDLAAAGAGVEALAAGASSPPLRRVLDGLLDGTAALFDQARGLPPLVASSGLRWECGVIVELAARLLRRLRRGDPVARRVKLRKSDFFAAFVIGVSGYLRG
jgi:hydroxysqualene synthase